MQFLERQLSLGILKTRKSIFPRGSLGLEGYSFVRDNIIDMTYKLDKNKTAFVLAGTVQHIWGELQKCRNNIYKVPLTVNEEIIASL